MARALSPIETQIMWNRLVAAAEEQAQTLVRTAFSTAAREAGDLSAAAFLPNGRMIAQAVTGTPGHLNSMAAAVGHFLKKFPASAMRPGDVFVTNDPWLAAGHLNDFTVVSPAFHRGRLVALFGSTCHVVDIGGLGLGIEGREIYHEGLLVPIMRLASEGRVNADLVDILRSNVREPDQVEGDLYALSASNSIGIAQLLSMLDEFQQDSIDELGHHIIEQSRQAMLDAIRKIPFGTYRNTMRIDGVENPVDLVATLTISDEGILIDFDGTSSLSSYGVNVPLCYSHAYASFAVHCVVAPQIPKNAGSLAPISVTAPEGCILNAKHPAPVSARHMIGQMVPDTVLGCFQQAMQQGVPAEGTSCVWTIRLARTALGAASNATPFNVNSFHSGGTGARPTKDGLSATSYPSGVKNVPVEVTESISPLVFWRKEYRTDSGGAGRWRGGLGQTIEIENAEHTDFAISATFDRVIHPPRGREGGERGMAGRLRLASGGKLKGMGRQVIPAGERLIVEFPGGGGYGTAFDRNPELVASDVRNQLVSRDAAHSQYGVHVDEHGLVDVDLTARTRQSLRNSKRSPG
jgi:N-methylhydantoinase B